MPSPDRVPVLQDFTRLSPSTSYYKPPGDRDSQTITPNAPNPDLIILCSWMGASVKNIAKYTTGYQTLFPATPILLVRTSLYDMLFRTRAQYHRNIRAAVATILSARPADAGPPRLLLHLASNGGAYAATQLAHQYARMQGRQTAPLPLTATVLDSSPGRATYARSLAAMMQAMPPNRLVRALGYAIVHLLMAGVFLLDAVARQPNVIDRLRRALLDERLFRRGGSRVYLYSKGDEMVWYPDVEEHAAEAGKDWEVETVRFERSPHVGHIREDAERYWGAIQRAWSTGLRLQ